MDTACMTGIDESTGRFCGTFDSNRNMKRTEELGKLLQHDPYKEPKRIIRILQHIKTVNEVVRDWMQISYMCARMTSIAHAHCHPLQLYT